MRLVAAALTALALAGCARAPRIEKVVLLGFDGAAPNLIEPLVAAGRLPALERLLDHGAYGRLGTFHPNKSNILWTSIATGKTMLKHGIVDWTYVDDQGLVVPYEERGRRVKTYWEILDERGVATGTLNWWVSYPPAPLRTGWCVSSAFKRRAQADSVYPAALDALLGRLRVRSPSDVAEERRRQGFPEWRPEEASLPLGASRQILKSYPLYFAQDLTIDRASDWLYGERPVRVFSTYFRLVDVTSHFATHFLDRRLYDEIAAKEQAGTLQENDLARLDRDFARVTLPAYAFMDRIVAKYLDRIDERTLLLVVSDHGFRYYRGTYNHAKEGAEPPPGVVFLFGPGVRPGRRIEGADLYDVAPTILWAMGQAAARDMDGEPLLEAFEAGFTEAHPLARIATYEDAARATPRAPQEHESVDAETLEDLRTLGYIGGPDSP